MSANITEAEKETVKRLWATGDISTSGIAGRLNDARGNRAPYVTGNMIVGIIYRARKSGEKVRISDRRESRKRTAPEAPLPARRTKKRDPLKIAQRPPRVHDKPAPPKPKEAEGELTEPEAALVDRTHLFRAAGQLDIAFMDRKHDQCAWPGWSNAEKTGTVCGLPVKGENAAYCEYHNGVGTSGH